jgi:hypothetical protein
MELLPWRIEGSAEGVLLCGILISSGPNTSQILWFDIRCKMLCCIRMKAFADIHLAVSSFGTPLPASPQGLNALHMTTGA